MSVSTIGGGGDTTIPSPGKSPEQPPTGIGLHDPLHGLQACPEFNSFHHQGVGQISPREGLFSCCPLPKRGQICDIPAPAPIVERLLYGQKIFMGFSWVASIISVRNPPLYCCTLTLHIQRQTGTPKQRQAHGDWK